MLQELYAKWKAATWGKVEKREYPQPTKEVKEVDPRFSLWWAAHSHLDFYTAQQEFLIDTGVPYDFRTM